MQATKETKPYMQPDININCDKYLKSLEFDKVLERLSDCAVSNLGKQRCLSCEVFNNKNEIEKALSLTTAAKKIIDEQINIGLVPLSSIADVDGILANIRLDAEEIMELANTLRTSRRMKTFLHKNELASLLNGTYGEDLISNKELEDEIFSTFDNSLNVVDNASPELKRLKNSYSATNENLKNTVNKLLNNADFLSHLNDTVYTQRSDRTVFQVKASDKNKVKGIVHDTSATNQTYFIEPEILVPINNKIRQIECEINAEIERILYNLSLKLHQIKTEFIKAKEILVELDYTFAKAKYSILTKSNPAEISDEKILKIQAMRHPLLIGTVDSIVENDFELGNGVKSIVVTGSNTGGKTVTLKAVGLLTVMTCAGLHIPSLFATIYPFKRVYSDISEEQSIAQSLSTFSAHIKNVTNILNTATKEDLVLFDELGAGTDPEEGAALARAILEYLNSNDIYSVTTTHLGELKILEYQIDGFKNASVEFDASTLKPTYKLNIGIAGSSNALHIAKNLDLKEEISKRAEEILSDTQNPHSTIFKKIEQTHQELIEHTKDAEISKKTAKELEETLDSKLKEVKSQKKKTIDNFKRKHQGQLDSARAEIKAVLDELHKEKSEKIARRAYSRLAKLEAAVREEFSKDEDDIAQKYKKLDWNCAKIGQSVLVKGINQVATLSKMPDSKGFAEVTMGLIKTRVKAEKLAATDLKPNKALKKLSVSFDDFHSNAHFTPRLDLRGMRADEALDELDRKLDMASLKSMSQVTIIHGHGTGALKKAIRDYLNNCPYVAKYRPGEDGEGGDGITVVDIV